MPVQADAYRPVLRRHACGLVRRAARLQGIRAGCQMLHWLYWLYWLYWEFWRIFPAQVARNKRLACGTPGNSSGLGRSAAAQFPGALAGPSAKSIPGAQTLASRNSSVSRNSSRPTAPLPMTSRVIQRPSRLLAIVYCPLASLPMASRVIRPAKNAADLATCAARDVS